MKAKNTLCSVVLMWAVFCALWVPSSAVADIRNHGSLCQPANASQALGYRFGSSHLGATNNSDILSDGTGPSFFITCPISRDTDDNAIDISVEFLDANASSVVCIVFSISPDYTKPNFVETVTLANPTTTSTVVSVGTAAMNTPAIDYDVNVVCALTPQTRLKSFYTYAE